MAKGDSKAAKTAINNQRGLQLGQQAQLSTQFQDQYKNATAADTDTRSNIETGYKNFNPSYDLGTIIGSVGGGGGVSGGIDPGHISSFGTDPYAGYKTMSQGLTPQFWGDFNKYMGNLDTANQGYKNFAATGGFSDSDLSNIRARSIAPTRAIYQNMEDELARQSSLGNINNPTARLRAAREGNTAISDAAVNTEAGIANQVQQGKEFGIKGQESVGTTQVQARNAVEQLDQQMRAAGLAGMTDIEKTRLQAELENAQLNQSASSGNASLAANRASMQLQADEKANDQKLAALGGWTNLYGTTPAATALGSSNLLNLQNLSQSGNLGLIGQQIQASQIPSDWSQAMGNIGSTFGLVGQVGGALSGLGGVKGILPGDRLPKVPETTLSGTGGLIPGINSSLYANVKPTWAGEDYGSYGGTYA